MKLNALQEKYLLYRIKYEKDSSAYGKLYDAYIDKIYRYISFKINQVEDVEDITAEVFLKVWQYIKTSDKRIDNLNALLYRMARNAVIDHYRSRQRDEMPMSDQEHYENIMDSREIDMELNVKLDMEKVETYLDHLKEEYRDAIVLRYVEQFSVAEIAHIMQKSTSNVRVILHRALERLRELTNNKNG